MDWNKIKQEYIADKDTSYRKLAKKHKVSVSTLSKVAAREKWSELREAAEQESNRRIIKVVVNRQRKRAERIQNIADQLLEKAEQAVRELDIQLYKNVEKTKVIEYKNKERPDKPTKETIHEEEKFTEVHTIIDRKGLQAVAAALKSLQEIQGVKSELDTREQKARIKKLETDAVDSNEDSEEYGVLVMPALKELTDIPSEEENG